MVQYHVFLPPPTGFSPFSLPNHQSKSLKRHTLSEPSYTERDPTTEASLGHRRAAILDRLAKPRGDAGVSATWNREEVESLEGGNGVAGPSRLDAARADTIGFQGSAVEESFGTEEGTQRGKRKGKEREVLQCGEEHRRKSARLTRSNESLLGSLPYLEPSGQSILSLNTTTSNPSQLPLTGEEHDTSVYHLPTWHIPLNRLSTLSALLSRKREADRTARVNVVVCVIEAEPAVRRRRKEERARGREGTLWTAGWKVTEPQGTNTVEVRLWEACAVQWGEEGKVRKGDVLLLQNVEFKAKTARNSAQLVLSPAQGAIQPTVTSLYRTLPRFEPRPGDYAYRGGGGRDVHAERVLAEDKALRPDLRLARSDPGVRKVAEYARWFADWIGGVAPP